MTGHALKDLPLGTSDFAALRMSDEIYVDKTKMVLRWPPNDGNLFLLAQGDSESPC